jgi:cell wall-associated NlpC family hydrolase
MKFKAQIVGILFIVICSFSYGQTNPRNNTLPQKIISDTSKLNLPATESSPEDTLKAREVRLANEKSKSDSIANAYQFPTFKDLEDSIKPQAKSNPEVDQMLLFAKRFLGTPYRYGGTTPSGFDCSGFIMYIMGNFGFTIARTSISMSELGRTVKISEARPGDLMFFKGRSLSSSSVGHVGMVYEVKDDGVYIIHASSSRGVVIENFSKSQYLIPRYLKVKRLDYGEM